MTSIDPTSALKAQLRAQLGSLSPLKGAAGADPVAARRGAASAGGKAPRASRPSETTSYEAPREDLGAAVARRVAAIDRQQPDRRRKAFRVFLESLLLDEWGGHLINDPAFQRLVGEVHEQMQSDPRLLRLMDEAADRLLQAAGD